MVVYRCIYCWVHLTHWARETHICVGNLTIIGSDNGLSPGRRKAIIWTNAEILLIGPLGIIFSEILIGIHIFSFMKMRLKVSSAKWRPFCLALNVLTHVAVFMFDLSMYKSYIFTTILCTKHVCTTNFTRRCMEVFYKRHCGHTKDSYGYFRNYVWYNV